MSNGFRRECAILINSNISSYTLRLAEIFSIRDGKVNTHPE